MTSITHAQLDWNESGTPVSDQFDDVYFSNVNGLEETRYVFLKQNRLPERWQDFEQRRFVIAETGFGTGLNFLAVWQWFEQFRMSNPDSTLQELHFISFEKYPLSKTDLEKAHQAWPELAPYAEQLQAHYPMAVPECHRIVLADGAITLDLWFGDIKDCMPLVPTPNEGIVDCWFLDGFAPSKNPEMWNQELFNGMVKLGKQDCTCATFTAAGFVRRGLIEAGFDMRKAKGFGTKRDMIVGQIAQKMPFTNYHSLYYRPNLNTPEQVAIIGGGIASACLTKVLANRGIHSQLFCKDSEPAQGASGNKQGAVYPLLNGEHKGVSRVFAPAFIYARQFAEQAATTIPYDHDWCGVTQLMWDEKSATKLERMLSGGFPTALIHKLDAEQTSETIGLPSPHASIHYPLGGWLCPFQLTQGLIQSSVNDGKSSAYFNLEVAELKQAQDGKWQVILVDGTIHQTHFDTVIVANGHKFSAIKQTEKLHLTAVKGQVSHIQTTDKLKSLKSVLCYDGYMTPNNPQTGTHCIGASYDRKHIDNQFDQQAQFENAEKLRHCIRDVEWVNEVDTSDNQSRQGIRTVSRDHLPFVGQVCDFDKLDASYSEDDNTLSELPNYGGLYCMLGLGSRGLSSAPLLAELLASEICGDPLPLPVDVLSQLHPARAWAKRIIKSKPLSL
ncbi:bifunctional tRNA (5-methylaminomethyl-2-thiouridine)(34)-methyltransferase MnmD/FAD-dependent 5-carboxymethylaminomethyl-2-thiouridine(34) oxidoreductase MnmC [Vibrio mediterranei]|uniref:bifunctional tRNA (5-methylaminomethyl-2-thiouridine)(34)-methyltransferase MnmD/FAD-dependent 5-carboxymethylaminomethyl-2-thiouridine(34) oxidoreductase MnmC n=1 Tax=Vibrio TaxID=662 RepID=UPI001EFDCA04|nr:MULTISPECIES: bifunctional tRNA (5-methylaminomethyl-2-thiouridine)(34)-methyltransferase MnmD/FAD-dependent 5-carboxymethylaminomethyl-2-thiouridine(34) oxidoreductase MnmC [Vibrio]MCG9664676.1 bifunctional tRNA (5-methylaminomethyl-2-thiouridine)(34)-methyltransferase MnmD/FAD-dependent 5-carboxymethylaminomethyl-2-thiouridine(34) oxidoreductase MnmC [Vibrio mediterranei]USE01421.1 bifunctional tRNA (5-methylaminomethyl-2-thiouridine)(34)-methyltransferase MnmD/FAD-dependent 5-carboxymethyla